MGRSIEIKSVPPRIWVEAFLSGSHGGPNSLGGLDGKGLMVVVDLEKREMVALPGFRERLQAWRLAGGISTYHLIRKPTLADLNSLINHDHNVYYDLKKRLIVRS